MDCIAQKKNHLYVIGSNLNQVWRFFYCFFSFQWSFGPFCLPVHTEVAIYMFWGKMDRKNVGFLSTDQASLVTYIIYVYQYTNV